MKFFGFFAEKYTNGITKTESPKIHNKENIVVSYINVNPSFLIDILGKNETQIIVGTTPIEKKPKYLVKKI